MVVWGKCVKVIEVPFAVGAGMRYVYLKPFTNGAGWVPFAVGVGTVYCIK